MPVEARRCHILSKMLAFVSASPVGDSGLPSVVVWMDVSFINSYPRCNMMHRG